MIYTVKNNTYQEDLVDFYPNYKNAKIVMVVAANAKDMKDRYYK